MTQPHPFDYGTPTGPSPRHRRRTLLIVLAIVVALVAAGSVFAVRGLTGNPADALESRFAQSIEWNDCGDGYYCGQIDVPVDWHDADSGTAHIALMEHRPKGTPAGTILVNPGGPGGSGVDFVSSGVENAVDSTIASRYDVIGFDPPGVGYSSAVKCYDASQQDTYLYGILPGAIGTKEWIAADEKQQTQFGDACQAKTGALLANVDTTSAARDMDLIRADLHETTLDYIGYSYGSYLGTIYAGLYPKRVGHFVFDGADDPWAAAAPGGSGDGLVDQAVGFEGDLKAFVTACVAGSTKATGSASCPLTGSADQGMAEVTALLDRVQSTPEKNSDGRMLGSATLATAISSALYDTSEWPDLASALRGVQAGDPKAAFALADEYNDRSPKGKYYDNTGRPSTRSPASKTGATPTWATCASRRSS